MMQNIRAIIEGLNCFTTYQHKCTGCPYNPTPGRQWVYGCIKGQNDIIQAAQDALKAKENGPKEG